MTDEYMAEGLSASERAELVLFGMERGSHRPDGEEKDLYAITKASLVRAIEAAERDARASAAATPPKGDYDFDNLTDLVARFSAALLEKLKAAEVKYGHNSGWMRDDWMAECQQHLADHLAKGDPRDVAAYCAFLWHHGWPTSPHSRPNRGAGS